MHRWMYGRMCGWMGVWMDAWMKGYAYVLHILNDL
jgi:hypothetical protein